MRLQDQALKQFKVDYLRDLLERASKIKRKKLQERMRLSRPSVWKILRKPVDELTVNDVMNLARGLGEVASIYDAKNLRGVSAKKEADTLSEFEREIVYSLRSGDVVGAITLITESVK